MLHEAVTTDCKGTDYDNKTMFEFDLVLGLGISRLITDENDDIISPVHCSAHTLFFVRPSSMCVVMLGRGRSCSRLMSVDTARPKSMTSSSSAVFLTLRYQALSGIGIYAPLAICDTVEPPG